MLLLNPDAVISIQSRRIKMLSINTNVPSLTGATNLNRNANEIEKTTKQISTGKRITSAADDPAGMGILSTMKSKEMSYGAVLKNLSAGQSLLRTSETALNGQQDILKQMKDLSTQAASDLLSEDQRGAIASQFNELKLQLDNVVNTATLFGQNLTGAKAQGINIQSGINAGDFKRIAAVKSDIAALNLTEMNVNDAAAASKAMDSIDAATSTVAMNQATIGTQLTGLTKMEEYSKENQTNLRASMSRIEDADIPELSGQLTQLQAKQQLSTQALQITNQTPNYILQLLR